VEELTSRTITAEEAVEAPIPDNDPAGITSALTMAAAGPILHLDVTVDISHTWVGDLVVTLVSPAAREIVLHNRAGGSRHDLKKIYSSKDGGELAPLINIDPAGVWRLRVVDLAGQDSGILHRWSMTAICAGG